jgi:hypothetical protein
LATDGEKNAEIIVLLRFSIISLEKPYGCRRFVVGIGRLTKIKIDEEI